MEMYIHREVVNNDLALTQLTQLPPIHDYIALKTYADYYLYIIYGT